MTVVRFLFSTNVPSLKIQAFVFNAVCLLNCAVSAVEKKVLKFPFLMFLRPTGWKWKDGLCQLKSCGESAYQAVWLHQQQSCRRRVYLVHLLLLCQCFSHWLCSQNILLGYTYLFFVFSGSSLIHSPKHGRIIKWAKCAGGLSALQMHVFVTAGISSVLVSLD